MAMIALAQTAEKFGYARYWVTEHHNTTSVVAANTPLIASVVAAKTEKIRVGGYVLLPHYTAYAIAEQMATLDACFPNRVDIAIGGATGADAIATQVLRGYPHGRTAEANYAELVQALLGFLHQEGLELNAGQRVVKVKALPKMAGTVKPSLLGGSFEEAKLAGHLGLPFVYPYHVTGSENTRDVLDFYRAEFIPSRFADKPHVSLSVIAVAAQDEAQAQLLARAHLYILAAFRSGELTIQQPLVEELASLVIPPSYQKMIDHFKKTWLIGTPTQVADQIRILVQAYGVDDIQINPVAPAYADEAPERSLTREFTLTSLAEALV